jgi:hypothetical protein
MKAKKLTENSWILISDRGAQMGIVIENERGFELITDKGMSYDSINKLVETVFDEKFKGTMERTAHSTVEKTIVHVNGFPIRHDTFCQVQQVKLPNGNIAYSYKLKDTHNLQYVAGCFGINFSGGHYVSATSPKLQTVCEYESLGPWKDEFTAKHHLNLANRELKS